MLAFFAGSYGLVMKNLAEKILAKVQLTEAHCFFFFKTLCLRLCWNDLTDWPCSQATLQAMPNISEDSLSRWAVWSFIGHHKPGSTSEFPVVHRQSDFSNLCGPLVCSNSTVFRDQLGQRRGGVSKPCLNVNEQEFLCAHSASINWGSCRTVSVRCFFTLPPLPVDPFDCRNTVKLRGHI